MKIITLCLALLIYSKFTFGQDITLNPIATNFNTPVEIKHSGDSRLFVVEKPGTIKILNSNGTVNTTPFLDISSIVNSNAGERGLLGLAFHPNYSINGYFFVNYTNLSGNTVIARYQVSANPDIANTAETTLLTITQPFSNHNGGCIAFGNDGYLYIATGDGGSGGDPGNRAQSLDVLLGKILRIDVDNGTPYGIPLDNPFSNDGDDNTLSEIWAYGLRNPWKFSFDADTDEIWIADVGQGSYEEINMASPTVSGINYGWRCYEGNATYNTSGCPDASTVTFPISEYSHSNDGLPKCSITGGYRYRGTDFPSLSGLYFFADYCSGEIGILTEENGSYSITFTPAFNGNNWTTFGQDVNNELYIADRFGGTIYRIETDNLGIEDNYISDFKLTPNPANGSVQLSLTEHLHQEYSATLYSLKGEVLKKVEHLNTDSSNISLENLAKGLYLVEISTSNGNKAIKKLIIQ